MDSINDYNLYGHLLSLIGNHDPSILLDDKLLIICFDEPLYTEIKSTLRKIQRDYQSDKTYYSFIQNSNYIF